MTKGIQIHSSEIPLYYTASNRFKVEILTSSSDLDEADQYFQ